MNELIIIKKDEAVTTSLQVAEIFGKRHDKLLHEIERMYGDLIDEGCVQNGGHPFFKKSIYVHPQNNQKYPVYYMNRDGFSLLVMGFTGKKAMEWKLKYIKAFNEMEKIVTERQTKAWLETREQGKITRRAETDVIKDLVEYAKEQGSTHADMLYMTYSKLANAMCGISKRDHATTRQLNNLSIFENLILEMIRSGIDAGLNYKEIYKVCKDRCLQAQQIAMIG